MTKCGDVFVLNIGDPASIRYLARRTMCLMELTVLDKNTVDGDVKIRYTETMTSFPLLESAAAQICENLPIASQLAYDAP